MRLDEYLEAIKNCPDEEADLDKDGKVHKLTAEFGIYDNFPILLKSTFDDTLLFLEKHFLLYKKKEYNDKIRFLGNYLPGSVNIQLWNTMLPAWATADTISEKDYLRQIRDYDTSIMLHTYNVKKIEGVNDSKALSIVIDIIGEYALKNNIPLCFPFSVGWAHLDDYSRIVYFP